MGLVAHEMEVGKGGISEGPVIVEVKVGPNAGQEEILEISK